MRNILQIDSDNIGGLEAVFYTAQSNIDFSRFPERDGLRLIGDITLHPGATWGMITFTRQTPGFSLVPKRDRRGLVYGHEIKGFLPKDTPQLAGLLQELASGRFCVLHQDNNGFLKLSGHPQFSLGFDYKYDSGDGPTNRNGYTAGFKAESIHPAFFYTGSFEVTDFGNMSPVPKEAGYLMLGSGRRFALEDGSIFRLY